MGLHAGKLDHQLLVELEQILNPECTSPGVVSGVVEFREAGQAVGFEVDAGVFQYPAGTRGTGQRLRAVEAQEEGLR